MKKSGAGPLSKHFDDILFNMLEGGTFCYFLRARGPRTLQSCLGQRRPWLEGVKTYLVRDGFELMIISLVVLYYADVAQRSAVKKIDSWWWKDGHWWWKDGNSGAGPLSKHLGGQFLAVVRT